MPTILCCSSQQQHQGNRSLPACPSARVSLSLSTVSLDPALTALLAQCCGCILQWLGLPQPWGILWVPLWAQHSPQCE